MLVTGFRHAACGFEAFRPLRQQVRLLNRMSNHDFIRAAQLEQPATVTQRILDFLKPPVSRSSTAQVGTTACYV